MEDTAKRPGFGHVLAYSIGNFPTGLLLLVVETWLMRMYCPSADETGRTLLVSPENFGRLSILVLVIGAVADPVVGHFSDRTRNRMGRRLPWILAGMPLLALSFVALWFPPVAEGVRQAIPAQGHPLSFLLAILPSAAVDPWQNLVWLTSMFIAVHVFFTVVVNPYLALMPELWTDENDRVAVSAWMSGANALSQVFAFGVLGALIVGFEGGVDVLGFDIADGYKVGALFAAVVTIVFFLPTLLWIRETPHSEQKDVPFGMWEAARQTLRNPAFMPYILAGALLQAAQVMVVQIVPYMVTVMAHETDDVAGFVLTGLVLIAAALFPFVDKLARKYRKRTLFMVAIIDFAILMPISTGVGLLPAWADLEGVMPGYLLNLRLVGLGFTCALIAPALTLALVVPRAILADIMDYDTQLTGYRREAMYTGMEGLIQKVAMALSPWAVGELFGAFGYTEDQPWGILLSGVAAGVMGIGAVISFSFYPLKK